MEIQEIRQYAELMREFGLTGLEIAAGSDTLRLERGISLPTGAVFPAATPVSSTADSAGTAPQQVSVESDTVQVSSPMVGVFYAAPAEDAKPYVQPGDKVKQGDVLCIIEAMKLMNEITSEFDGIVERVCVGNRQVVDFGHPLFIIRRTDA